MEYEDQTEVFPSLQSFETASAREVVVDSDFSEIINDELTHQKNYIELENVKETTLSISDDLPQFEYIANTDGIGIVPTEEITFELVETQSDDLNIASTDGIRKVPMEEKPVELVEKQNNDLQCGKQISEEMFDPDKENEQEQHKNPDYSDINGINKTENNDSKKDKKNRKFYVPQLWEPCKLSCRQKCRERLTENERKIIFKNYHELNFREKRLFLDKHIVKRDIKYRKADADTPRKFSVVYNLPNVKIKSKSQNVLTDSQSQNNIVIENCTNQESVEDELQLVNLSDSPPKTKNIIVVCKSMFMNTLGLKSDSIITDYLKRTVNDLPVDLKDKRGQKRAEMISAIAEKHYEDIKRHIDSYHPQVSHYNLEHAPKRRYLPCDITIREMYKDFISKVYNISYETYRKVFDKENIGFGSPTQDECGVCSIYKNHVHENNVPTISISAGSAESEQVEAEKSSCEICQKYEIHKTRYTVARQKYNEDSTKKWTSDFEIFSVDMQKILILPKMTIKKSVFVSRLVVFHETFANLQAGKENKCVLWHEAIRGRNGPDVVSAFYNVLKRLNNETKHVIFWTDNCTAQNKNWTLFTACVIFVNEAWGPETITFKYFEPGHSFMKADSIHGLIGKKWKHTPEVLDYEDLVHLIESSNKLNRVVNLRSEDFLTFENGCQARKKGTELPKLNDIKCVQFVKGSKKLLFKYELEQETFSEVSFLKPKLKIELPHQVTTDRGINQSKKDIIIKELVDCMPQRKQLFWKNLPSRENVEDLGISAAQI